MMTSELSVLCDKHGIMLTGVPPYKLGIHDISEDCQYLFNGDLKPIIEALDKRSVMEARMPKAVKHVAEKVNLGTALRMDSTAWLKKQVDKDNIFYDSDKHNITDPKELESFQINKEVDWIIDNMPEQSLNRLAGGMERLPIEDQIELKRSVLGKAGSAGSMAGARRALMRLDVWLCTRFGSDHGFKAEEAVVCWFLMQLKDTAVRSARTGLVFASLHYKLPLHVVGEAGLALTAAPAIKRGPALSTTIRVLYAAECLAVGVDPSGKRRHVAKAVRYYAAVKCVRSWATLRSIDARRSRFVKVDGNFLVGEAYAQKTKKNTEMTWAAPMASVSGHSWWRVLIDVWQHADSLHVLPTCFHGDQIFSCETMSLEVASSTQLR